eukprot:6585044-Pyramimonas_sp.AAC.1
MMLRLLSTVPVRTEQSAGTHSSTTHIGEAEYNCTSPLLTKPPQSSQSSRMHSQTGRHRSHMSNQKLGIHSPTTNQHPSSSCSMTMGRFWTNRFLVLEGASSLVRIALPNNTP